MLPEDVLLKAQAELLDYESTGMSIMEMSHRSAYFDEVIESAKMRLRRLMSIPSTHEVMFLHGGATTQFYALAEQFNSSGVAAYINTGQWSSKAIKAASTYGGGVDVIGTTEDENFCRAPTQDELTQQTDGYNYVHYTPNETIGGVRFPYVPDVSSPLVADFSSSILSEYIDVSKFDFIYAGAQKNIGPAGIVVVIASKAFLTRSKKAKNPIFDYCAQVKGDSRVNTPSTYSIYLANLVFEWLESQGGVAHISMLNQQKAKILYSLIDSSDYYHSPIDRDSRSWMNVPFQLHDNNLNKKFLEEADAARLYNLAGHRSVGGMRASIYNAMPLDGVIALTEFMTEFARQNG